MSPRHKILVLWFCLISVSFASVVWGMGEGDGGGGTTDEPVQPTQSDIITQEDLQNKFDQMLEDAKNTENNRVKNNGWNLNIEINRNTKNSINSNSANPNSVSILEYLTGKADDLAMKNAQNAAKNKFAKEHNLSSDDVNALAAKTLSPGAFENIKTRWNKAKAEKQDELLRSQWKLVENKTVGNLPREELRDLRSLAKKLFGSDANNVSEDNRSSWIAKILALKDELQQKPIIQKIVADEKAAADAKATADAKKREDASKARVKKAVEAKAAAEKAATEAQAVAKKAKAAAQEAREAQAAAIEAKAAAQVTENAQAAAIEANTQAQAAAEKANAALKAAADPEAAAEAQTAAEQANAEAQAAAEAQTVAEKANAEAQAAEKVKEAAAAKAVAEANAAAKASAAAKANAAALANDAAEAQEEVDEEVRIKKEMQAYEKAQAARAKLMEENPGFAKEQFDKIASASDEEFKQMNVDQVRKVLSELPWVNTNNKAEMNRFAKNFSNVPTARLIELVSCVCADGSPTQLSSIIKTLFWNVKGISDTDYISEHTPNAEDISNLTPDQDLVIRSKCIDAIAFYRTLGRDVSSSVILLNIKEPIFSNAAYKPQSAAKPQSSAS